MSELLDIAAQADTVVMFDLREPDPANPFAKNASELVIDVLKRSSLNISKVGGADNDSSGDIDVVIT